MSLDRVRAWRDALAADAARAPDVGLSRPGLRLVLDNALDALDDRSLAVAVARGGRPFPRATFVAARTVSTAPLEWLAVLLGRGTEVTLKHPRSLPGLAPWLRDHAHHHGLPLAITDDRAAVRGAPLVIAMGDDATLDAVRQGVDPDARFLGFGSRASVAWWPAPTDAGAAALARDLAAHDGRGCMSPAVILTEAPDAAVALLARALADAEARWPRGTLSDAEHAALRARAALARVVGDVREGPGWSVHLVPAPHVRPVSLPRAAQVVAVRDLDHALDVARPWAAFLSTVGADDPAGAEAFRRLGAPRVCALGAMQAPPLLRNHDGVDALALTGLG